MQVKTANRWLIATAGVMMQLALGAVYAWSVFRDPLVKTFGWTISEVTLTFTITILTLGFSAFLGGLWMRRVGPRTIGIMSGFLYGIGMFLASFSAHKLWVLYLTYGLLSGIGIGFGYIVPVATLVKWFPDKRGFITGIAVAGFGAGALLTAPIATRLVQAFGVLTTFAILGVAYGIMVVGAALFMRNPPEGFRPAGWQPSAAEGSRQSAKEFTLIEALRTSQWYALWLLLFLNVTAGISIISQVASMAREITGVGSLVAAGVVGTIAIANGAGRFFWAWLSDYAGRKWVVLALFLVQAISFFIMPRVTSFWLFTILVCIVLLCYGGGFGTMPAFATDYFGSRNVGAIYGLLLTAWGLGGVFGPMLIAFLRESTGNYTHALYIIAGMMLISSGLPLLVRPPRTPLDRWNIRREGMPSTK